jgi:hypothetical protein
MNQEFASSLLGFHSSLLDEVEDGSGNSNGEDGFGTSIGVKGIIVECRILMRTKPRVLLLRTVYFLILVKGERVSRYLSLLWKWNMITDDFGLFALGAP